MAKRKDKPENFLEIEEKARRLELLINLSNDIREKEKRLPIHFNDFLYMASKQPELIFRDIFQLFHDMVKYYVPEGVDDYKESDESIGFVLYDMSTLFVKDCDNPFFADRLFANRFMNLVNGFRRGIQNNLIYFFEGPPGSGKSTFLNILLHKLEEYTKLSEGSMYNTYWRIDIEKVGGFKQLKKQIDDVIAEEIGQEKFDESHSDKIFNKISFPEKYLEITCPNNDHPILQIPKIYRKNFLNELITDKKFKEKLFNSKEYEWVLKDIPCSICNSVYNSLLDKLGNPLEVFNMLNARKVDFNRQFGKGISVYNPGDKLYTGPIKNQALQYLINKIFKNNEINYIYSDLANTNNGVLAIMDVKENNVERLMDLHGIISDSVHKVEHVEESIKSLFFGLVNPEDKKHFINVKSFQDRIVMVNIPYILDFNTEVAIYKNKFGHDIEKKFLPRVLKNFAKIIISSRLETEAPTLTKWIDQSKYSKHLDENMFLLKMDIYSGKVPKWLKEEDIKRFGYKIRKNIISESETEGKKGFSGRQSLSIFNSFFSKHSKCDDLITMDMVKSFFIDNTAIAEQIPEGFVESLEQLYEYNILEEVKEAIYYYNEQQISRDIQNYLFSINFDLGETIKSEYTGDTIEVSEEYYKNFEAIFLGTTSSDEERKSFRKDNQHEYIKTTLSHEIKVKGKTIQETTQFKHLFDKYIQNLKENALAPFIENDNFRRAVGDFGTSSFATYDSRMKRDIAFLISNLKKKFDYTEEGAKQVSVYVLEKKLAAKF